LAVSKTIIEAHKGRLWAENRSEGGACFCFTLPVATRME
jgi:K+-sensing histidine kinase KdpD